MTAEKAILLILIVPVLIIVVQVFILLIVNGLSFIILFPALWMRYGWRKAIETLL